MKYFLTYHAINRLKERFPQLYNKFPELKDWDKYKGMNEIKPLFDSWIENAEENKSYINNTKYMLYLYEKYGYDVEYSFKEYKEENILFVFAKKRADMHYKLVTLMPTEYKPTVKNIKYNAKPTKEAKHAKLVMDFYDSLGLENKNYVVQEIQTKKELPNLVKQYKEETISTNHKLVINIDSDSLSCQQELAEQMFDMLSKGKVKLISKISSSKSLYQCRIDDMNYEFLYTRTQNGTKSVSLKKVFEISEEEKELERIQQYITPELKEKLLSLIFNNLTVVEKISNTRSIHTVEVDGVNYNFLCLKTAPGDRKIILQKDPYGIIEKKDIDTNKTRVKIG